VDGLGQSRYSRRGLVNTDLARYCKRMHRRRRRQTEDARPVFLLEVSRAVLRCPAPSRTCRHGERGRGPSCPRRCRSRDSLSSVAIATPGGPFLEADYQVIHAEDPSFRDWPSGSAAGRQREATPRPMGAAGLEPALAARKSLPSPPSTRRRRVAGRELPDPGPEPRPQKPEDRLRLMNYLDYTSWPRSRSRTRPSRASTSTRRSTRKPWCGSRTSARR